MIKSKESAYKLLNEFRKVLFEVTLDKRSYEVETEYQFDKIIESLNRKEMEDRFPHPKETLEETKNDSKVEENNHDDSNKKEPNMKEFLKQTFYLLSKN